MARLVTIVSIVLLNALPASAQDRLFEGRVELGAIGHFGTVLGPAPVLIHHPLIGGGRFAVTGNVAVDLRSGAELPLGPGRAVAYDRVRPRVFMARADGVWGVDAVTGAALLVLAGPTTEIVNCAHAYSADVLICVFPRSEGQHDIVRAGAAGPELLLTTRFTANVRNWVLTPDAVRMYFRRCTAVGPAPFQSCVASDLSMLELPTGTLTSAGAFTLFNQEDPLQWDEVHERLLSVGSRIEVFNKDLVSLGGAHVGERSLQVAISPHTGRMYLAQLGYYYGIPPWSRLTAFDSTNYHVLAPGVTRQLVGYSFGPLTLLTAPGAPRDVRATVSGRTVSLTWTNVGAASVFVLEAGLAPGRTDLSVFLGPSPQATFVDVPAGTYYLRLRGGNEFGGGRPSHEVQVTVH